MKSKAILGVDVGKKGSMCLLIPETGHVDFIDLDNNVVCLHSWLKDVFHQYDIEDVYIELVRAMHGRSLDNANFAFGYNAGMITTLLELLSWNITEVSPATWRKHLGVSIPKDIKGSDKRKKWVKHEVSGKMKLVYPDAQLHGVRGGILDGRSDALAIAYYGISQMI